MADHTYMILFKVLQRGRACANSLTKSSSMPLHTILLSKAPCRSVCWTKRSLVPDKNTSTCPREDANHRRSHVSGYVSCRSDWILESKRKYMGMMTWLRPEMSIAHHHTHQVPGLPQALDCGSEDEIGSKADKQATSATQANKMLYSTSTLLRIYIR